MTDEEIEAEAKRLGVPVLRRPIWPGPRGKENPVIAICGVCGVKLHGVMYMSCNREGCPAFLRVVL